MKGRAPLLQKRGEAAARQQRQQHAEARQGALLSAWARRVTICGWLYLAGRQRESGGRAEHLCAVMRDLSKA